MDNLFCVIVSLKKVVLLRLIYTKSNARMAELVDALVSKTSEVTLVPVRPRLRVQREAQGLPFLIKELCLQSMY